MNKKLLASLLAVGLVLPTTSALAVEPSPEEWDKAWEKAAEEYLAKDVTPLDENTTMTAEAAKKAEDAHAEAWEKAAEAAKKAETNEVKKEEKMVKKVLPKTSAVK